MFKSANTAVGSVGLLSVVVSISDTYWSIYLPVNQQIDIKTELQFFAHFPVDRLFSTSQGTP
jgi:hypothetical protein